MGYEFTPEHLRTYMRTCRDSVDLKVPMQDDFKLYFIQDRAGLLSNFIYTANAWLMMLRTMSGNDQASTAELGSIMADVEEFHLWARVELGKLDDIAAETQPD